MSYYIDGPDLRRNEVTCFGGNNGPAYNAVLYVQKSDEEEGADPVTEPVTLQEAKDWCRIDVTNDDTLITALITAARIICEQYANLSFVERDITAKIHNGLGDITLPYGPVTSDVTFTDADDVELEGYAITTAYQNNIYATYSAGYATLPKNLKTALLNQIAWMYDNRGDAKVADGVSELSKLILNQVRSV